MKTTYELLFEPCQTGVRVVVYRDYYSDGERELIDIIEKYAPLRADKIAREVYKMIAEYFYLETARIIEAHSKNVIFENYDDDDHRASMLEYLTKSIKTVINEKRNE